MRPPIFDELNTSVPHVGDLVSLHMHDLRRAPIKALKQEWEYLAKRVSSKLTAEEREMLYLKWDIPPEGKQRRRLQLVNKLWSDLFNMEDVRESAEIVAKLVGFC
ncbi:hypothetical protein RND71_038186 [Anisodus tanguticus]|uniref:NPK1-activating kinesin-like protein C-terminal domain-containing protein n=1 Tax=Anisodus tanguticus TaxID=243964 RepID=A0AAE1UZ90_9SOLA|nr:hypothetical protein RND71_038186 [Anisodus tanguticus]